MERPEDQTPSTSATPEETPVAASPAAAETPPTPPHRVSRRNFVRGTGAGALAALAAAGALAGVEQVAPRSPVAPTQAPAATQGISMAAYPVPTPPTTPYASGRLMFFTPQEFKTVEALTATLLPGSPDDPGAREAGVAVYIDNLLAYNQGFAEPAYFQGPFAQVTQEGGGSSGGGGGQSSAAPTPTVPQAAPGATGSPAARPVGAGSPQAQSQAITISSKAIDRYGYQSALTPAQKYRAGLPAVDTYAKQQFGKAFVDLSESQQEAIVGDMEDPSKTGFDTTFQAFFRDFFATLRQHTIEGMFCDPLYGGNRDLVGWKLVGYPGAQRGYTPRDLQTQGTMLQPQGLAQLHPFNPGYPAGPGQGPILPVSGPDEKHH